MILRIAFLSAILAAAVLPAQAQDYQAGALRIDNPIARPTRPGQPSSAAYMTIENSGKTPDRLIGARSPIAKNTEIHSMIMDGNVMKMREVPAIDIQPETTVVMQPGDGYHVMMLGLKKALKPGDKFPLTLTFEKAGKVELSVAVEDIGASHKAHPATGGHHHKH